MKTIGLLGGMSWESTVTYYQIIDETVMKELGGLHSAKILMHSAAKVGAWSASLLFRQMHVLGKGDDYRLSAVLVCVFRVTKFSGFFHIVH